MEKSEEIESDFQITISTENIVNGGQDLLNLIHEIKQKILLQDVQTINKTVSEKKQQFEEITIESNKILIGLRMNIRSAMIELINEYSASQIKN